jgi:hypothetical protein
MNLIPVFFSGQKAYFLLSEIFCRDLPIKYEILCGYDKEIRSLEYKKEVVISEYKFLILKSDNIGSDFESIENSIIKRVPVFITFREAEPMLDLHLKNAISIFLQAVYF